MVLNTAIALCLEYYYGGSHPRVLSLRELALPIFDLALFVVPCCELALTVAYKKILNQWWYETQDVIGVANQAQNLDTKQGRFRTCAADLPDSYISAIRAQQNQVEQFPFFAIVLVFASLVVGGKVAGALGLIW